MLEVYLVYVLDSVLSQALKSYFGFVFLAKKFGGMPENAIHNSRVRNLARAKGMMGVRKTFKRS